MEKVKFLVDVPPYEAGEVVALEDAEAQALSAAGEAEIVGAEVPPEEAANG